MVDFSRKGGTWCPACPGVRRTIARKLTIEKMKDIARDRDGESLSEVYINTTVRLILYESVKGSIPGRQGRTIIMVYGAQNVKIKDNKTEKEPRLSDGSK